MRDVLAAAYNAAFDKAATELDTWRCPKCRHEVQFSGAVHIEWGTPECEPCQRLTDARVPLRLIRIEKQEK